MLSNQETSGGAALGWRSDAMLAVKDVGVAELAPGNDWALVSLDVAVPAPCNSLEFRVFWHGAANVDVAFVRAR